MLFELYKVDEVPYVQIFYKNSTAADVTPIEMEIPSCGKKCPLEKMYEIYRDILPTESFEQECALREGESLPIEGNPENNSL